MKPATKSTREMSTPTVRIAPKAKKKAQKRAPKKVIEKSRPGAKAPKYERPRLRKFDRLERLLTCGE